MFFTYLSSRSPNSSDRSLRSGSVTSRASKILSYVCRNNGIVQPKNNTDNQLALSRGFFNNFLLPDSILFSLKCFKTVFLVDFCNLVCDTFSSVTIGSKQCEYAFYSRSLRQKSEWNKKKKHAKKADTRSGFCLFWACVNPLRSAFCASRMKWVRTRGFDVRVGLFSFSFDFACTFR